jgi:hypothetical protein
MQTSDAARAGTALVPMKAPGQLPPPRRALATFVAHLIANAQQAPQTRMRRRAEPDEAVRRYRAALAPQARRAVISRSL